MAQAPEPHPAPKLGPAFEARLRQAGPGQRIYAVVLLATSEGRGRPAKRRSPEQRKARAARTKRLARRALREIDAILKRHNGRRLAAEANALGAVPIEATPAGIRAVAECDEVKAVLEDQPVTLPPTW